MLCRLPFRCRHKASSDIARFALAAVFLCVTTPWACPAPAATGAEGGTNASQPALNDSHSTSFQVSQFLFLGNTVFSDEELTKVVQSYAGRGLDLLELEQARVAVTRKYIDSGYINSGALIDRLPGADGTVIMRIVEGRLTAAEVHGSKWLRQGFYRSRLGAGSDRPLNAIDLRNELQLWRIIYPLDQVNSELRPGTKLGEATLDLTVKERFPYHAGIEYANDRPPSTGSDRLSALVQSESLTGNGDQFALNYVILRGGAGLQDPDFPGVDDLSVAYTLPITRKDTALGLLYARSSAVVVEEQFKQLNITGNSEVFGVSITQPIVRTPTREFSLTLRGERESNRNFLLGQPYSFSPGAINGESIVTAARLSAQWVERSERQVISGRLTFSEGLDALDATRNAQGPEGQFFSILGQGQYLRRLGKSRNEIQFRVVGQYTPDPLLTLEQLAIGGANSVRGYTENLLLRDCGTYGTLEFHVPLWSNSEGRPYLQLVPFASIGAGWNNERETPTPTYISSAGIGVVLTPCAHFEASLFWGYPFQDIEYTSQNPQNEGFHFKVSIWAF